MVGLKDVIFEVKFDFHTNENRTIVGLLGPPGTNSITLEKGQVRIAKVHKTNPLASHYRDYAELYGIIGSAIFTLEDPETKERQNYAMETGNTLHIPAGIGLRVNPSKEAIIICLSESFDREKGTHKYIIE